MTLLAIAGAISSFEYLIPLFLATIFAAALLSSKTKVPYTMMLVGIGILVSLLSLSNLSITGKNFSIDPRLIIDFVIPPLIFEAMMKVNYEDFKKVRITTFLLVTIGVVLATAVCGLLLMYVANLPFAVAFIFAALISPTDAAIVIEIFKRVKVPRLLNTLMDSEASLNDATGVIAFTSVLAITAGLGTSGLVGNGLPNVLNVDLVGQGAHFAIVFLGGAGIGLGIAVVTHRLHKLMDDPFSEIALTVAMVFGSVVLANALGVSGLVAVAVAGLYFGNFTTRSETAVSENVRKSAFYFWEMIAFFANSVAFLYLGITMDILKIGQNLWIIALAFASVLAARAASSYPILALTNKFTKEKMPRTWRNIIFIGGMRGALSVALAASLPESESKVTIETITFGVVLCSLLIQFGVLSGYVKRIHAKGLLEV